MFRKRLQEIEIKIKTNEVRYYLDFVNDILPLYQDLFDIVEDEMSEIDEHRKAIEDLRFINSAHPNFQKMSDKEFDIYFLRQKMEVIDELLNSSQSLIPMVYRINTLIRRDRRNDVIKLEAVDEGKRASAAIVCNYELLQKTKKELELKLNLYSR